MKCFRGLSLRLSAQASETCWDLHSLSPTWMLSMLSYCLGKSILDKPYWLSQISVSFFIFKSPSKQHHHIPAEYFPIQEKKIKTCTKYSDRLRKKIPQTIYLDLIQANTHWFQGDFNFFRIKLNLGLGVNLCVWSLISLNYSHFLYSTSSAKCMSSVQYIIIPFPSSEKKSQSNHNLWAISILLRHCLSVFKYVSFCVGWQQLKAQLL